jgi:mRNA-degrading endonuclease RelE of RelBE toxin-antitoxin system
MAKRVIFTDQARADIRAVPQPIALQILHTLARFLESEEGNVKRLLGVEPPLYRLRTQDHRVIFRDLGDHVEVTRVRDRKDAYR